MPPSKMPKRDLMAAVEAGVFAGKTSEEIAAEIGYSGSAVRYTIEDCMEITRAQRDIIRRMCLLWRALPPALRSRVTLPQ
jgi:hypothetical protein